MNTNCRNCACLAFTLFAAGIVYSQQLCITNLSCPSPNVISLGWTAVTDRYIVAQCTNLNTAQFQYVGSVLSTNQTVVTSDSPVSFFRVRKVRVVDMPDPGVQAAVLSQVVTWYEPSSLIYDIDLEGIVYVDFFAAHVTTARDSTGLNALRDLAVLRCQNNLFTNLNLSGCANLEGLWCGQNQLTNLDLSDCTNLKYLWCGLGNLTRLDLSGNPKLSELRCDWNQLTNLDLSACPNLTTLVCSGNPLTNLDLSTCTNLTGLKSEHTQLTYLDVSSCPSLSYLNFWANNLTNLNLTGCTNLSSVNLSYNQLTDLSSLVTNAAQGGLGAGDTVDLSGNPLSASGTNQIPILQFYGVTVYYE